MSTPASSLSLGHFIPEKKKQQKKKETKKKKQKKQKQKKTKKTKKNKKQLNIEFSHFTENVSCIIAMVWRC